MRSIDPAVSALCSAFRRLNEAGGRFVTDLLSVVLFHRSNSVFFK